MSVYAKERDGCWHEVALLQGDKWTAVCGLTGEPYAGQPSSVTELALPPSPLHCSSILHDGYSLRDHAGVFVRDTSD